MSSWISRSQIRARSLLVICYQHSSIMFCIMLALSFSLFDLHRVRGLTETQITRKTTSKLKNTLTYFDNSKFAYTVMNVYTLPLNIITVSLTKQLLRTDI